MISRRSVLAAAAWAAVPASGGPAVAALPLWPGPPPGGGGPSGPERTSAKGAVSDIAVPGLRVVAPARPNGAAMLVAAGGGYERIEMGTEAEPAAQWLAARGVTAFVLAYRLPGEGWAAGAMAPLQDAQRALRVIRANAGRFGVDGRRVGVLGFSAGGHLMGLAAARAGFASYPAVDGADGLSARPDLAALAYPVITLMPPYTHTATRKVLVGSHPDAAADATWSVETHVTAACPPVFLVQAEDDPVSDPANTRIMAAACQRAGVKVEMHRLPSGGHGFGMGVAGAPSGEWPDWLEAWLRRGGFVA